MEQSLDLNTELELFQSRLKQREDKIGHWLSEGTKQIAENQSAKHAELMRKGGEEVQQLKASITTKKQQATERNQSLKEKCEKLEILKGELMKLSNHSEELKNWQKQAEKEKGAVSQEINGMKDAIDGQSKTREKLEYLNKACGSFENVLGLSFKKTKGNRMQVIFTEIDEKDPTTQFYFFLQIEGSSRKYVVTDPEPGIDGLPELVDKLNSTNNIRAFMIEIRQKFKETLKP